MASRAPNVDMETQTVSANDPSVGHTASATYGGPIPSSPQQPRETSIPAPRCSFRVFPNQGLEIDFKAISAIQDTPSTPSSSETDRRVPIVVAVNVSGRTKIINAFGLPSQTIWEPNLSHEVLLVDPSTATVLRLKEMMLDVFLTGSTYRDRGNVMPADLEGLSEVQDLYPYRKDGLKVWVHEANVQAVLRLVGESKGKQVLHVVLK